MDTPPRTIQPQHRDLGDGFTVHCLLPVASRQEVGPWLSFDHFGPVQAVPPCTAVRVASGESEFIPLPARHPGAA